MVDWKTQRTPLLPSIPAEKEHLDFDRLVKWRRSMLDVISLHAANVYDDLLQTVANVNDTSTVNLTLANNVLSAVVIHGNISIDSLGAPIYSNGRLDANSSWHGLCPKLSGNAVEYLSGTGGWSVPAGGNGNGANHPPASINDSTSINFTIDSANQIISGSVIAGNIKLDTFGTPDDNSNLNASNTRHGLLPKLSANASEFLAGDGTWAVPGGGANSNHAPVTVNNVGKSVNLTVAANQLMTANVVPANIALDALGTPSNSSTLDSNTSRHGLLKRLSGNSNEFLNGNGNWAVPPAGNAANCEAGSAISMMAFELSSETGNWLATPDANQYMNYLAYNYSNNNYDAKWSTIYLAKGTYRIEFLGAQGPYGGILQFMLDLTSLGTVDTYKATFARNFIHTVNSVNVAASNTFDFKLRVNSKNASSNGYLIYLTYVSIKRIA